MFRKVFQNRPKKKCAICGDDAIGINFNVETCLACKAFFRRNALLTKELSCPFNGNCQITKGTRRICRYKKCVDLNMKKEWILSDSERMKIKEKVAANKAAKRQQIMETIKQLQCSTEHQVLINEKPNSPLISQNGSSEHELLSSIYLPAEDSLDLFESIDLTEFVKENLPEFDDLLAELDLEFTAPQSPPQSCQSPLPIELTFFTSELLEPEIAYLRELLNAGTSLKNPYRRLLTENDCEYSRWCRMPQHTMHRLLRFAKGMRSFNAIPTLEAQSRTLKLRLIEMLAICSTTALFDRDRQGWALLDDISQASVIVSMTYVRPFCTETDYRRHQALPGLFRDEWREDNLILDLLTAIVLFCPDDDSEDNDDQKHHLQAEHTKYTTLLSRYLHLKYPSADEADVCYRQMMAAIEEMRQLNGDILAFFCSYKATLQNFPFFVELLQLEQKGGDFSKVSSVFSSSSGEDADSMVKVCANDSDAFAHFPIAEVLKYLQCNK